MYVIGHKRWNGAIGKNKFVEFLVIISGSNLNNIMISATRGLQIVIHNFHVENYLHKDLQRDSNVMKFDPTWLFSLVPKNDCFGSWGDQHLLEFKIQGVQDENIKSYFCIHCTIFNGYEAQSYKITFTVLLFAVAPYNFQSLILYWTPCSNVFIALLALKCFKWFLKISREFFKNDRSFFP